MQVLAFSLQLIAGIALTWWVLRRDMARLSPQELARSWNSASFWCAIVAFSYLCIPVHFAKSRRSLLGLLVGIAWMAAVMAVLAGIASLVG